MREDQSRHAALFKRLYMASIFTSGLPVVVAVTMHIGGSGNTIVDCSVVGILILTELYRLWYSARTQRDSFTIVVEGIQTVALLLLFCGMVFTLPLLCIAGGPLLVVLAILTVWKAGPKKKQTPHNPGP